MAGLLKTWSNVRVWSSHTCEIHYQMVEVCEAHVMSWKQVWMWYNAFNNDRAHADGKQKLICSCTSTMADILCYADACITEHRSTKLKAVGWEVDVLQGSVHCTVHNWTPEKFIYDRHQSSLWMVIKLVTWNPIPCIWNIKPIKESSFCSTLLKGMKHGLMWHQNSKSIYDVETHHFLQARHTRTKHCCQ